jgi:hypothetical protein
MSRHGRQQSDITASCSARSAMGLSQAAPVRPRWHGAWPAVSLATLLAVAAAYFIWALLFRSDVAFFVDYAPAHWIVYAGPGCNGVRHVVSMETVFHRRFSLDKAPAHAELRVRAFRHAAIRLNDRLVSAEAGSDRWKQESRHDVTGTLRKGENELVVTVMNDRGPPALWLALEGPEPIVVSDRTWEASRMGATWRAAALASDPQVFPGIDPSHYAEHMLPSLQKVWPVWLVFAGVSAVVLAGVHFWLSRTADDAAATARKWTWITRGLFVSIAVLWTVLFVHNSPYLYSFDGFDAPEHLNYVSYIREKGRLPLADEGYEMQHPPFYYLLAALATSLSGDRADSTAGLLMIRLLNLGLGLCGLGAIWGCLRLLFPDNPRCQAFGLIFAAFLPMQLYLYQYPTNEICLATLSSVAIYFVLRILCVPTAGMRDYVVLGLALGAALLTKLSAAVLIPPVAVVLVVKLWLDRSRENRSQAVLRLVVLGAVLFGVCGWHYIRVWDHFGRPIVTNADPDIHTSAGYAWWQDPGYYTWATFSRFGACFRSPLVTDDYSLWDTIYATCWADGQSGAAAPLEFRPAWSYDFVAAGFVLALFPAVALLVGLGVAMYGFTAKPVITWTFLLGLMLLTVFFLLSVALAVPTFAFKGFYGLFAMVPLAALAALGLNRLSGRWRWSAAVVWMALGVWALNGAMSYWASAIALSTQMPMLQKLLAQGDVAGVIARAETLSAAHPQDTQMRLLLHEAYTKSGQVQRARQMLDQDFPQTNPARWHMARALALDKEGRVEDARREYQKALRSNPDDETVAWRYACMEAAHGNREAAIEAFRDVARINPYRVECHAALAQLYGELGRRDLAQQYKTFGLRLMERPRS